MRRASSTWRLGFPCHVLLALLSVVGCGETGSEIPRTSVSGRVTLGGRPLEAGAILFESFGAPDSKAPWVAYGMIEKGIYEIPEVDGPIVGTSRVRFLSKPVERERLEAELDRAGRNPRRRRPTVSVVEIPEKYSSSAQFQVNLVAGENREDFALEISKP